MLPTICLALRYMREAEQTFLLWQQSGCSIRNTQPPEERLKHRINVAVGFTHKRVREVIGMEV